MLGRYPVGALFSAVLVFVACGDDITQELIEAVDADALLITAPEPAGENCAEGGTALSVGLDLDGDGALSDAEVSETTFLCDAASGAVTGSTVISSDEPAGENCANGGVSITTGVDADGDGALSGEEVASVTYVCAPDDVTIPAVALTSLADEPAGENCPNGGVRLDAGVDVDADGALAESEVTETAYACFPNDSAGEAIRNDTFVGGANAQCPGGFVVYGIGLDENDDGVLQEEEQTVSVTACNLLPVIEGGRLRVDACNMDNNLAFAVADPEGELALVSVETLSSGASTVLQRLDDFIWTLPAGEHRGGMRLNVTAADAYGAEASSKFFVTFDGEGCLPVETFYGVDPDTCTEIEVEDVAGDDRGGVVLSESYAFYNGDDGLVRTNRDLDELTLISSWEFDTLVSDTATFELFTLWSSAYAGTNMLDVESDLRDLDAVYDQLVPVDEDTLELGRPIELAVPVALQETITVDLASGAADIVASFPIDAPFEFEATDTFIAIRGDIIVLGLIGYTADFDELLMYLVMNAADGALMSAYVSRDFDDSDFQQREWADQEVRIARLPLVQHEDEVAIVFRDRDDIWVEANVYTGARRVLTQTYGATCDSDHLALDFETGRAYGHSEMTCFGDRLAEETLHVCDMLYVSNIDSYVDDRGAGDN